MVWVGGVGGFGFRANLRSYLMLVFGSCLWVFWLACLAIAFEMVVLCGFVAACCGLDFRV